MNSQVIKIAGEVLDLDDKVKIATTFQNGSIGDLASRFASYTNQIKVPITERNRRILGFSHLSTSRSTIPYTQPVAEYSLGSSQLLAGIAQLREYQNYFGVAIYDGMKDVFTIIGDKLLSEIDFGEAPITWNAAYIDSRRNAASGLVSPVIQYGQIDTGPTPPAIGTYYFPSIYVKDVFTKIFENAGVTLAGNFLNQDDRFTKMIIAYSRNDGWPGTTFTKNQILPDVKQSDFVKDIAIKFNLKFREVKGVVTVKAMKNILRDTVNVDDWSNKRNAGVGILRYQFGNFAQKNYFGADGGDYMAVNNLNLKDSTVIYEDIAARPFADSFSVNDATEFVQGANIRLWDNPPASYTQEFDHENSYKLLLTRTRQTGGAYVEPAFLYDGNSRSDYLVGYFANDISDFSYNTLAWRSIAGNVGLLDLYYSELEQTLQYAKVWQYEYILNEKDTHDMDITRLVYDNGEFFLRDQVRAYVPGQVTRVDLLKIW